MNVVVRGEIRGPKRLLVFDVEGTLFQAGIRLPGTSVGSTIWQAIAAALGPDAIRAEVETHRRWGSGEYRSYLEWMKDTIEIHLRYGLSEDTFRSLVAEAAYNEGVRETLERIDRDVYEVMLVTGGFRELAARAQLDLMIPHAYAACEYLFDRHGRLSAYNLLPCDFEGKIDFIELMLREYRLGSDSWIFVGDGPNDASVAAAAPVSVAYGGDEKLGKAATHRIDAFDELLPILDEFATRPSAVRATV
jgi:phosphoserine phosphatase